jgi:hypothetical protein
MEEVVKIYGLYDPINNETFYVGKTINPLNVRLHNHIAKKNGNKQKERTINNIIIKGKRPLIWEICSCNKDEWELVEIEMIRFIRDDIGCPLTNIAPGGMFDTNYELNDYKNKKSINQYDINGNYIRTYKSIAEAARYLNKNRYLIIQCINNRTITAYGYLWCYVGDEVIINDKVNNYINWNNINEKNKLKLLNDNTKQKNLDYRKKWRQSDRGKELRREQKRRARARKKMLIV